MLKRVGMLLVLVFVASCLPAVAYTVVLKNGKTIKGTLISETDEKIIFKDEQGLQYSLKKTSLDLAKMAEANAPPPTPAPAAPAEPSAPEDSKKSPKVYTTSDLETLR
jgi:hypothetical protein